MVYEALTPFLPLKGEEWGGGYLELLDYAMLGITY